MHRDLPILLFYLSIRLWRFQMSLQKRHQLRIQLSSDSAINNRVTIAACNGTTGRIYEFDLETKRLDLQ